MPLSAPPPPPAPAAARPARRGERARRRALLSVRAVLVAGALLALLVVGSLAALAWHERNQLVAEHVERAQLFARVLEEHASRSVETVSLAIAALADAVAKDPQLQQGATASALSQALAGLPLLRGVAVVDMQGHVLLSSGVGAVDQPLQLGRLGALPMPGRDLVYPFVAGRGLAALTGAAAAAPAGVGFVPMLRTVEAAGAPPLLIVALVNPDAIANHQQQTLDDPDSVALLADYEGRVLASTRQSPVAPGGRVAQLPPFRRYLPAVEHASYVGEGLRADTQIVAFRASRHRPLVVLVETSQAGVLAAWRTLVGWIAAAGALSLAVIGGLTAVAARSVRTRERARAQRDAAQAEVAQREHELSVIVRSVQELIFRTDAAGRLTFVNARWQAATGLPTAQIVGRRFAELVEPTRQADAVELFAPGPGARTAQLQFSGGGGRRFDVALTPLLDGDTVVGFAGSAVDVTAREAAQARLRAELAFSALLVDTMPLPVSLLDREGCYVTVNRAWEDLTGRHRDQVIGRRARDQLPPEEAAVHDAHDRKLLTEGGQVRYEVGYTPRDGSRRQLAIVKAAVPDAVGRFAGILVCVTDISEIREAERATREARDAAEEASRAKSEFIANISHELRTPLQSIIGFSELGQMRGRQHEKLAAMFGDIHQSGQRMLALVNDLLDVSKIESTVGTFHLERTDLRPLVREVARELEPLLGAKRLHLEVDLGDVPLVAKVDPLRFQQVVRNVLANAVKFSPEEAPILLQGTLGHDSRIRLSVRDRGPGIPPAELEKIFEAFVQSSKTKDGSGGTGLGLAICRKIVEAHGGRIGAENAEGGGSRFTIELPARGFADTAV